MREDHSTKDIRTDLHIRVKSPLKTPLMFVYGIFDKEN